MLQQLREILGRYVEDTIDVIALEDWLVSHLQAILDSQDEEAIEIANALDVLFLKLNDGFLSDEDFLEQAAALSLRPRTVVLPATSISTASGSETLRRDPNDAERLILVA